MHTLIDGLRLGYGYASQIKHVAYSHSNVGEVARSFFSSNRVLYSILKYEFDFLLLLVVT